MKRWAIISVCIVAVIACARALGTPDLIAVGFMLTGAICFMGGMVFAGEGLNPQRLNSILTELRKVPREVLETSHAIATDGRKIEAVKHLRAETNMGLSDSMFIVERLIDGGIRPSDAGEGRED